jgi:hypothetical protein
MASVFIDGVDVTANCTTKDEGAGGEPIEWHRRGGRPSFLTLQGPSSLLGGSVGISSGAMTGIGAGFTGVLWRRDDIGDENDCWSTLTFADTTIYFPKRIVKDGADSTDPRTDEPDPGNFSDPSIIEDYLYGPSIMAAAVDNSNTLDGPFGPVGLNSGGAVLDLATDLTGFRPTSWPLTLDQLRALLSDAGVLAYKVNGTTVTFYEGPTVAGGFVNQPFNYGTGSFNCSGATRSIDMENVFTVVWTLLGPKQPLYTGDIQHWRANVTIDDNGTGTPPPPVDPWPIPDPPYSAIAAQVYAARAAYGRMQVVDEVDMYQDERTPAAKRYKRRLAQMLWLQKSLYCATPRQIVTMIPEKGILPSFDVYDTVPVAAGSMLNGGFSGEQRIYEFKVSIDTEGNAQLKELVTSPQLG